jgi:hypothetical protein
LQHDKVVPIKKEEINHPPHYGGQEDPYEHIKVAEHFGWGYHLGNATKYIWRAGLKNSETEIEDIEKAIWYLNRYIAHVRFLRAKEQQQ